jgi:hypothetical protein
VKTTTKSSKEFDQNARRAENALPGSSASIIDLLGMPEIEDLEFDPPKLKESLARPADFDGCAC